MQQLLLFRNVHRTIRIGHIVNELPEILFRQNNDPDQFAERNTLLGPAGANCGIALLNVAFAFLQQPRAQVMVNFVH